VAANLRTVGMVMTAEFNYLKSYVQEKRENYSQGRGAVGINGLL